MPDMCDTEPNILVLIYEEVQEFRRELAAMRADIVFLVNGYRNLQLRMGIHESETPLPATKEVGDNGE